MKKNDRIFYSARWMKKCSVLASITLVALYFGGCSGVPPTYYYRVDYTSDSTVGNGAMLPVSIVVAQFSTDILYEGDKMVYRNSPYEAQFYHYRRWVAPPRKIVTEKVLRQYQASRAFDLVVRTPTSKKIDYTLTGNILAFEEWDEGDSWFGIVSLEFSLQDVATHEVVWSAEFSEKTRAGKKHPVEVARAISTSLDKVVGKSIGELSDYLAGKSN